MRAPDLEQAVDPETDPPAKEDTTFERPPKRSGAPAEEATDSLVGARIGEYHLEKLIGQGGWSRVYHAIQLATHREVAIKVLAPELAADPVAAERMRREAQILGQLGHPNIVTVLDSGRTPDGRMFLVLELLPGRTIGEALRDLGAMEPERVIGLAHGIALGLQAAHAQAILHRDLKPANVKLVESAGIERPKILDFGISRVSLRGEPITRLTAPGQLLGTPSYMSPERILGAPDGPAGDFYALGVMIHEMLTGKKLFKGRLLEIVDQKLNHQIPPLPEGTGLDELVGWLLEKEPEARPTSAAQVTSALENLTAGPTHGGASAATVVALKLSREHESGAHTLSSGAVVAVQEIVEETLPPVGTITKPVAGRTEVTQTTRSTRAVALVVLLVVALLAGALWSLRLNGTEPAVEASARPPVAIEGPKVVPATSTRAQAPSAPQPEPRVGLAVSPAAPPVPEKPGPRPRGKTARLDPRPLRARLGALASEHGLSRTELSEVESVRGALARFEAALDAGNAAEAPTALVELEQQLAGWVPDQVFLKKKVARIAAALERLAERSPSESHGDLERRFLDLRAELRPGMAPEKAQRILRSLGALETEIDALSR
jgi:serine/threonine-protein kinase